MQPILVYMSKVDGKFMFSPLSVNFLTEAAKVIFAIVMLLIQVYICTFINRNVEWGIASFSAPVFGYFFYLGFSMEGN